MHQFNEIQDKAFEKLKILIIYDLKKNNIDLDLDKNLFLKYHNNIEIEYKNIEEKEKISSTLNFYNYILDSKSAESFLKIYFFITEKKP